MSNSTEIAVQKDAAHMVEWADDSKHQIDQQEAQRLGAEFDPNSPENKNCWALYLLSNVDRANIGNAKTGGLEEDFKLTSTQYSIIVLVFFTSYIVCEVPSNMILGRVRPSVYLPTLAILWGVAAACQGACQNWHQIVGLRFLIGFFESGFAPGCAFYLSSWYRKYELASRYAWLYTSVAVAGAVSGLLAGVITEFMDGAAGIAGWRWLFIIEGVASIVLGVVVMFVMPDYPTSINSKFLTKEERILACNRLAIDGMGLAQGAQQRVGEWTALKMTIRDWRTWCLCFLFVMGTGSQTIQYFIPSLVETFGWKVLTVMSGSGFVFFVATTTATDGMVRYVLAIFAFGTIYGCSPLTKTWISHVLSHPSEKRAVAIALINALGNGSSIYGSFLWPDKDSPRFTPGFATTTAWMGALAVGTVVSAWLFKRYPSQAQNHEAVMASQLRAEREQQQKISGHV
ncbi:vitamin h [Diaporthe amygdali]|uniref:vitamin h n=1 Tax=Phomopsis amygdali TaxID=1214568 RepID=UPI0022FF1902|nr:vitamin h [Diaporthe amygdali]KAJ0120925.1 vitamin h [Diaporthe amygdali]